MNKSPVRLDLEAKRLIITDLVVTDSAVVREAARWTDGVRGLPSAIRSVSEQQIFRHSRPRPSSSVRMPWQRPVRPPRSAPSNSC